MKAVDSKRVSAHEKKILDVPKGFLHREETTSRREWEYECTMGEEYSYLQPFPLLLVSIPIYNNYKCLRGILVFQAGHVTPNPDHTARKYPAHKPQNKIHLDFPMRCRHVPRNDMLRQYPAAGNPPLLIVHGALEYSP